MTAVESGYTGYFKKLGASADLAENMALAVMSITWKPFVKCWINGEAFDHALTDNPKKVIALCQNCIDYAEVYKKIYKIATEQIDLDGKVLWDEKDLEEPVQQNP